MQRILIFIIGMLLAVSAWTQADTVFVLPIEITADSTLTDSTFRITCTHAANQLPGTNFLPTGIQQDHQVLDGFSRLYRVKVVQSSDLSGSVLDVVELQNSLAPAGTGVVYRKQSDSECIPVVPMANSNVAPATLAAIFNHNAVNGCGGGSGGGGLVGSLTENFVPVADTDGNLTDSELSQTASQVSYDVGNASIRLTRGASNVTPTVSVINSDSGGKAAALLAGTTSSAFEYDKSGFFQIASNDKSRFLSNSAGTSSTGRMRIDGDEITIPGNLGVATALGSSLNHPFEINGSASFFINPHDNSVSGTEGVTYNDDSENRPKYHDGTEFLNFLLAGDESTAYTPTSTADSNGDEGDIAYDDDYVYIKTSAGWKRAALSTF